MVKFIFCCVFFVSSRRRHTTSLCDWSSDVCSSDLGQWLMVDCGVTFADDSMPGIDLIMADPAFIAERRDRLAGLVVTHGHEDHIGAIAHLWRRFRCPIYATPFTRALLRE